VVSSQKGLTAKFLPKYLQYNQEEMLLRRKLLLLGVVIFVLLCFPLVVSVGASSMWSRTYGGTSADRASSLVVASDGGYAMAGYTNSFGAGGQDFWLVKTDADGKAFWAKTYGGTGNDKAYSLVVTSDRGYALAGYTASYAANLWLVKTDSNGLMLWNKTYGGTIEATASSLVVAPDGGYAIAGSTLGNDSDFLLVKTDALGNMEWNQTYGGTGHDFTSSLVATSDGGYAIAGTWTYYTPYGEDYYGDFWLVKTDELGITPEYSSWLIPALVLTATAFIIINKKRLLHKRS
jgi:hypothetical protein